MKNGTLHVTDSQKQVLDTLWSAKEPLTSSELIARTKDRIWKPSYIHILINSLLSKGLIRIAGFRRTKKNYARTFEPTMSKAEFYADIFLLEKSLQDARMIPEMLEALLEDADKKLLDELENIILRKRDKVC